MAAAVPKADKSVAEISQAQGIHHPSMVSQLRGWREKQAGRVFESTERKGEPPVAMDIPYHKIGQTELGRDFLASRPVLAAALQRGTR